MKLIVRILAEAKDQEVKFYTQKIFGGDREVEMMSIRKTPILDRELINIEDVFTGKIVQAIMGQLYDNSPYDRRMASLPMKKFKTDHEKKWAKARPPKDRKGHLKHSWTSDKMGMGKIAIRNYQPYARYLFEGTGIYGPKGTPITPREKKAMQFYYSTIKKWMYARTLKGINPVNFRAMVENAQLKGTEIGIEKAIADQETKWRGTLQTKLIRL